jgi:hypothetical protein
MEVIDLTDDDLTYKLPSTPLSALSVATHSIVYHCDHKPDQAAALPIKPTHVPHSSPAPKLLHESRLEDYAPRASPVDNIEKHRYKVFEMNLVSAVDVKKTLFKYEKDETVEKVESGC